MALSLRLTIFGGSPDSLSLPFDLDWKKISLCKSFSRGISDSIQP